MIDYWMDQNPVIYNKLRRTLINLGNFIAFFFSVASLEQYIASPEHLALS